MAAGVKDRLAAEAIADGDDDAIRAILAEVCAVTGMGFAAVARVTEDRWIACQILDKIEFGLEPGSELEIQTTICDDIRKAPRSIVIDHVAGNPDWRTHHTPMMYGFESYVSIPLFLDDGSFYGTLCAIDPHPRQLSSPETVAEMERCALAVSALLSSRYAAA